MSKRKNERRVASVLEEGSKSAKGPTRDRKSILLVGGIAVAVLLTLGVFAKNGWLPSTGTQLSRNAGSSWNPFAAPSPTATPGLSREFVYASGSRLVSVVDSNAQETPPADLAVWRPTTGGWWVMGGQWSQQVGETWGTLDDDPVEGDYDGDGKTDFAVYRPSTGYWYIVNSSDGTTTQFPFGQTADQPAPGDYDGDGKTESALFRPSEGKWYIRQDAFGATVQHTFGQTGDKVAPADYDGDGKADISLWREANTTFYSLNSSNLTAHTVAFTHTGVAVSSDYDGDGKADHAVRNGATWVIRKSTDLSTYSETPQGDLASDIPVQNDYDGDGKTDIAVWRKIESSQGAGDVGKWYIRQSASGNSLRQVQWGISGDIPVPALYRR